QDLDNQVLMPFSTMQSLSGNRARPDIQIQLTVAERTQMDAVVQRISRLLRNAHGLGIDEDDDFQIQTAAQLTSAINSILTNVTVVMGGIVGISLLVGGIGIMNIMLVSVTERTREIGICKAIGAKRHQILLQFLFESGFLSLLGGLIALLTGYRIGPAVPPTVPGLHPP